MTRPIRTLIRRTRWALGAYARSYEDGITAAIFAVALLVLLGMVALGIDGSRIYDERRKAQYAADHAAIAAAWESCIGSAAAAIAAGEASALENGYDPATNPDAHVTIVPEVTGVVHRYTALVDTTIGTTFAQIMGFASLETNAFARAEATGCEPTGSGVPAIFGGGDCPGNEKDIDFSGNFHVVTGLLQTNGSFYNGGSDSTFTNPAGPSVQYRGDFEGKKPDRNVYDLEEEEVDDDLDWPVGFDPTLNMTDTMWNAYRDSPLRAPSNQGSDTQTTIDITDDGIYYSQSNSPVVVEDIEDGASFVVVSKNSPVRFGNQHDDEYFAFPDNPANTPDNVIVVSGFGKTFSLTASERCSQMAFLRSGNDGIWNGIFWTPHATIEWSGNEGIVNGGLIGWGTKLNGFHHEIHGGTGIAAANPNVYLTR